MHQELRSAVHRLRVIMFEDRLFQDAPHAVKLISPFQTLADARACVCVRVCANARIILDQPS